jgi:endonuclease YncB( thermonuclease family)
VLGSQKGQECSPERGRIVRKLLTRISAVLLALLWALPAAAATLPGRVLWVTAGDTLTLLGPGNAQYRVRLAGIDAPELGQRYGQASEARLSRLVTGRFVVVSWQKRDRYGRIVGKVLLADEDVGLAHIDAGLAWHYKKYQDEQSLADRTAYAKAEEEAREARRGLRAEPVPPWEWHRTGTFGRPDAQAAEPGTLRPWHQAVAQ